MRVTVTGASGLIGTKLVERLRDRGDDVTTLSRSPSEGGAIGWQPDATEPLSYLVFDPRADEDSRIFWIRGDYVQQIRHA